VGGGDFLIHSITTIDAEEKKTALIDSISGLVATDFGGLRAIGDAVQQAFSELLAFNDANGDQIIQIIDVSTSGPNTVGTVAEDGVRGAIGAGIDFVNCLGVGSSADCNFNDFIVEGFNGLDFFAADFDVFNTAIALKLAAELTIEPELDPDPDPDPGNGTSIPEPSTLALFATGLAGLGFFGWRRRNAHTWPY